MIPTDGKFATLTALALIALALLSGAGIEWLAERGERECSFQFASADSIEHVWITTRCGGVWR